MTNFRKRLHDVIPGGAHTYSRGDDQFPDNAPPILVKGEGAYVWDPDGKRFLDYGMGLRSVNLGYGDKDVAKASYNEMLKGNNLTRASTTELEAAELFKSLIPSVDMVKFAKHGSTVVTAAIKMARASTKRKYIVIPEEHPFFSFDDWFIGTTPLTSGTLPESSAFTLKFKYNNIESLEKLFEEYPNQIAAVMLEPATTTGPCPRTCSGQNGCHDCSQPENFLHKVKRIAHKNGALFILDEMITGFRWHLRGAQSFFNIEPDLCTFGKAMANGFAVAALGGKKEFMQLGSILDEGRERIFLTSTTHGAEMSALGAFIKTVEILKKKNVIKHFWNYGEKLMDEINRISTNLGIEEYFYLEGYPCSPNYVAKGNNKKTSLAFRTLFSQEMIKKNVLMPYIAISYAHKQEELDLTLSAVESSLNIYKRALESGIDQYLHSSIIKPVFRKFN